MLTALHRLLTPTAYLPKVGARAPDFTLLDPSGKPWTLRDLLTERALVLFFYPEDETYGCTREACAFRDSHAVFAEAGVRVVGVSADSAEKHRRFIERHKLPYLLLSDPERRVHRDYGVASALGVWPGRTTFVIDQQGIVRNVFSSVLEFERHVAEALAVVRSLANAR